TRGQVSHALLTRPPLPPKGPSDLHVLGTPPAFVLSQDQTLHQSPKKGHLLTRYCAWLCADGTSRALQRSPASPDRASPSPAARASALARTHLSRCLPLLEGARVNLALPR